MSFIREPWISIFFLLTTLGLIWRCWNLDDRVAYLEDYVVVCAQGEVGELKFLATHNSLHSYVVDLTLKDLEAHFGVITELSRSWSILLYSSRKPA